MRRLLLSTFLLLLSAMPLRAQIQVSQIANNVATSATAVTVTISSPSGHMLIALCGNNLNSTSTITMSDSNGSNTWTQAGSYEAGSTGMRAGIFWSALAGGSVTSVTCTWSGSISARVNMVIYDLTGANSSTPIDSIVNNGCNSCTSQASSPLTTTHANDALLYGLVFAGTTSGDTPGTGFTFPTNSIGTRIDMACQMVTATQSNTVTTTTWTGSASASGLFVGVQSATASSGTCTPSSGATPLKPPVVLSLVPKISVPRFMWKRR